MTNVVISRQLTAIRRPKRSAPNVGPRLKRSGEVARLISSNGIAHRCRPFCCDVHRPASPVAFVPALEFTDESVLDRAKYEFRSKRRDIGAFRRYRLVSVCRSWEWRPRTGLEKGHRVSYLPFGRGYRCGGPYSSPGPSVPVGAEHSGSRQRGITIWTWGHDHCKSTPTACAW